MNVKVQDLMVENVMSASPSQSIGRVREVMKKHRIHSMPVLDEQREPVGIVTSTDVLSAADESAPVSTIMSDMVFTVPGYGDPSLAARIMRNHHLHHVLVTHEKKLVGIVSSFDLLKLVEDHRFVMKGAPGQSKRHAGSRKKGEQD